MKGSFVLQTLGIAGLSVMLAGFALPVPAQEPIDLGSAITFGVLAGSTVTNVVDEGTVVTGNLGVSPGTAVTGFPPGIVTGSIYTGPDSPAAQAQADLTIAYNDAVGRDVDRIPVSGDLGGMTLTPGLYHSALSLALSSGDLILDGGGDFNAVFIFQMGSTLIVDSGRQVFLIGNVQAANIYWQVGSSATLGTNSVFHGTIMADQSITLEDGARLDGRALALNAAVTLDSNVVRTPSGGILRVDLLSFTATSAGVGSTVTLNWETAAEIDNVGFNIYRAENDAPGNRLNPFPISPQGSETESASYSFVDAAPMTEGEVRGYFLEDVEFGGKTTLHGPIHVGPFTGVRTSVESWAVYN